MKLPINMTNTGWSLKTSKRWRKSFETSQYMLDKYNRLILMNTTSSALVGNFTLGHLWNKKTSCVVK